MADISKIRLEGVDYDVKDEYARSIIGTGDISGNAGTATKLLTGRTIQTDLESTEAALFDGTANITPGVMGVLPVEHGGTGNTTGSISKLGSDTVGSGTKPIYLNSGTPTASTSTVGSTTQPVYLNAGTITAMTGPLAVAYGGTGNTTGAVSSLGTATVGGTAQPIYLDSGSPKTISATVGSTTQPVYLNSGTVTAMSGALGVSYGGTGLATLTSGYALLGNGTSSVSLRAITNNTATGSSLSGSTNLITLNTLRYAMNRTTDVATADTNYTTLMARGIQASTTNLTAGTSSLTNGAIYLVYE